MELKNVERGEEDCFSCFYSFFLTEYGNKTSGSSFRLSRESRRTTDPFAISCYISFGGRYDPVTPFLHIMVLPCQQTLFNSHQQLVIKFSKNYRPEVHAEKSSARYLASRSYTWWVDVCST
jgi:hypothetical protein